MATALGGILGFMSGTVLMFTLLGASIAIGGL